MNDNRYPADPSLAGRAYRSAGGVFFVTSRVTDHGLCVLLRADGREMTLRPAFVLENLVIGEIDVDPIAFEAARVAARLTDD